MQTADWGFQGEYVNSGCVDLGKLVIAKLRAAWTVRLASAHHPMEDNGRDTVFITFGAMSADSSLLTLSRHIPTGKSYSRYVITVGTYPTKHPKGEPSKNVTPSKARA